MNAPTQIDVSDFAWGTDLDRAPTLDQQIEWLNNAAHDPDAYCTLWRASVAVIGGAVSLPWQSDRADAIGVAVDCDAHMEARNNRIAALVAHLDNAGHRLALRRQLYRMSAWQDREVTQALRDYLRAEGSVFVTPKGDLRESVGLSPTFIDGSHELQREYSRAARAYLQVKRTLRGRRHIARAVRMLGQLHEGSGCIVLEAKRSSDPVPA